MCHHAPDGVNALDHEDHPARDCHRFHQLGSHDEEASNENHSIGILNDVENDESDDRQLLVWVQQPLLQDKDLIQHAKNLQQDEQSCKPS